MYDVVHVGDRFLLRAFRTELHNVSMVIWQTIKCVCPLKGKIVMRRHASLSKQYIQC